MDKPYRQLLGKYIAGIFWMLIYYGYQEPLYEVHLAVIESIEEAEDGLMTMGLSERQLTMIQDWCKSTYSYAGKNCEKYPKLLKLIFSARTD